MDSYIRCTARQLLVAECCSTLFASFESFPISWTVYSPLSERKRSSAGTRSIIARFRVHSFDPPPSHYLSSKYFPVIFPFRFFFIVFQSPVGHRSFLPLSTRNVARPRSHCSGRVSPPVSLPRPASNLQGKLPAKHFRLSRITGRGGRIFGRTANRSFSLAPRLSPVSLPVFAATLTSPTTTATLRLLYYR